MRSPYLRNGYPRRRLRSPFWDRVFWRKIQWQCTDLHSLFILTELYVTLQKILSMLRQWARQFPSSHFGLETLNVLERKNESIKLNVKQGRQVLIRDSFGLDCCHLELLIGSLLLFSFFMWIRVVRFPDIWLDTQMAMHWIKIMLP